MFLAVRLWDAFADLFAGRMVDRTMTRFGKFRPFILWFAVPVLFLSVLNFNVPTPGVKWLGVFDVSLSASGRVLYMYLAYAVLGLCYSLINIPYGSLASAMTQSVSQRAKLVAGRAFGAAIGGVLLTYIVAPRISALQKTAPKLAANADATAKAAYDAAALAYRQNVQSVFTTTTLLFVLIGSVAFLLTFFWCRESVVRTTPKVSIRETFDTLKHNKPLAFLCAASFFYLIGLFAVSGSTAYYAKYVMGDISQTATMTLMNSGIALLITPLIPAIIRRFGKKTVFQWCGMFTVVGGVSLFFTPVGGLALALIFLAVKGIGASAHQHRDVRPRGGHRRVRRVEVRQALRGCDVRDLLVHPQGDAVHRRRARCVDARLRRLPVGHVDQPEPGPAGLRDLGHPVHDRPAARDVRDHRDGDLLEVSAHRQDLRSDPQRERGREGCSRR